MRPFLEGSKEALERATLIQIDRRLALEASPLALATVADLAAIRAAIGPSALPEQRELLLDSSRPAAVREAAASALARAGDPSARAALLESCTRADPAGRALAAGALSRRLPDEEVRRALEALLHDSDERVRLAAARGLGEAAQASESLARALGQERSPAVIEALLISLGRTGGALEEPVLHAFAREAGAVGEAARRAVVAVQVRGER